MGILDVEHNTRFYEVSILMVISSHVQGCSYGILIWNATNVFVHGKYLRNLKMLNHLLWLCPLAMSGWGKLCLFKVKLSLFLYHRKIPCYEIRFLDC
jgi:hypothetical protein